MEAAVVWLVIWGVLIFVATPLGALIGMTVGFLIGVATDSEETAGPIGIILGYIAGGALAVFAIIQTIFQIISVVQIASA